MDAELSITLLFLSPVLKTFGKPNSDPFQYLCADLDFNKSFRKDLGGWIFLPVQSLTPDWMEQIPVSHAIRPSVKADHQHPQHHPHHHLPNHLLTREVIP